MELRALAQKRQNAIATPQKEPSVDEISEKSKDQYNRQRHRNLTNVDKRKNSVIMSPRDISVEKTASNTGTRTTTKTFERKYSTESYTQFDETSSPYSPQIPKTEIKEHKPKIMSLPDNPKKGSIFKKNGKSDFRKFDIKEFDIDSDDDARKLMVKVPQKNLISANALKKINLEQKKLGA